MTDATTGETATFTFTITATGDAEIASTKSLRPLDDDPLAQPIVGPDGTALVPGEGEALAHMITGFVSSLESSLTAQPRFPPLTNGWMRCGHDLLPSSPTPPTGGSLIGTNCVWSQNP
jgi:hypothetical protein